MKERLAILFFFSMTLCFAQTRDSIIVRNGRIIIKAGIEGMINNEYNEIGPQIYLPGIQEKELLYAGKYRPEVGVGYKISNSFENAVSVTAFFLNTTEKTMKSNDTHLHTEIVNYWNIAYKTIWTFPKLSQKLDIININAGFKTRFIYNKYNFRGSYLVSKNFIEETQKSKVLLLQLTLGVRTKSIHGFSLEYNIDLNITGYVWGSYEFIQTYTNQPVIPLPLYTGFTIDLYEEDLFFYNHNLSLCYEL